MTLPCLKCLGFKVCLLYPNDGELDGKDMDSEIERRCVYTYMGTCQV